MYLPEEIWREIWQYDTRYREMYNIVLEDLDRFFLMDIICQGLLYSSKQTIPITTLSKCIDVLKEHL